MLTYLLSSRIVITRCHSKRKNIKNIDFMNVLISSSRIYFSSTLFLLLTACYNISMINAQIKLNSNKQNKLRRIMHYALAYISLYESERLAEFFILGR